MKRFKIAAGNWKMNTTNASAELFLNELTNLLKGAKQDADKKIIIFPPYTHLNLFSKILKNSMIEYGAQNLHQNDHGAFTGEISAEMLTEAGCRYVIVGHSERRQYFHETNELLALKIRQALKYQLTPIYCIGETLDQRQQNIYFQVIEEQLNTGLFHLSENELLQCIIAYEPVWAIGTGVNATPAQAQEVHHFIRLKIAEKYNENISQQISILYGGSIKPSNSAELFSQPDIDGGLIGGASLQVNDFFAIINSF